MPTGTPRNARSNYSIPLGECSVAISFCLCICLCVCLYVREHISGTVRPIFTSFFVQIPCGRGSVLIWRRCNKLCNMYFQCYSRHICHNGPFGDAWSSVAIPGRSLMSMNALFLIGINYKLECDVLLSKSITQLAPVLLLLCMQFR